MKIRSKTFLSLAVLLTLAVIYVSINLIAAPPRTNLERYHLSSVSLRLLDSTVVVPVVAIWFVAFYGYEKLRKYSQYIAASKEGKAVSRLVTGIFFFVCWIPISSTFSTVLNLLAFHNRDLTPTAVITVNYLTMLFPLLAFIYIARAARDLSTLSKQRPNRYYINAMSMILILAGVFYGYLVANAHATLQGIYHLPILLILSTIVVPYIFSWYLGLLAAYEIHLYTKKVRGLIYRKSWNTLALGIVWLILFSIIYQYLTTVSVRLSHLSLTAVLSLTYTFLPLMAVGYVFVAVGAKRLTKIEEV